MASQPLHAPWRMSYIRSLSKPDEGECFLCAAERAIDPNELKGRLVLWKTELSIVVINMFPYTNGHLLIAPRAHKADLEELSPAEVTDLQTQTTVSVKLLKRAMSAQGFNIGINLGRCAGAGLPGHLHQHVVPRWNGDTNFMSVLGDVRVVPQAMDAMYEELIKLV